MAGNLPLSFDYDDVLFILSPFGKIYDIVMVPPRRGITQDMTGVIIYQ